jgi:hypothetical protein
MKRAAVLLTVMAACHGGGPYSIAWTPYSVRMSRGHIAQRAILIGEGDIGVVRKAGGLPAGTITMRGAGYSVDAITWSAAIEAAEYGGTHYMMGKWSESTSTSYTGHKIGDTWFIVPHDRTTNTIDYVVIRVPTSGWGDLPADLTPVPWTGER